MPCFWATWSVLGHCCDPAFARLVRIVPSPRKRAEQGRERRCRGGATSHEMREQHLPTHLGSVGHLLPPRVQPRSPRPGSPFGRRTEAGRPLGIALRRSAGAARGYGGERGGRQRALQPPRPPGCPAPPPSLSPPARPRPAPAPPRRGPARCPAASLRRSPPARCRRPRPGARRGAEDFRGRGGGREAAQAGGEARSGSEPIGRRGHGGDELARGRAEEDPQPAGTGGRRGGAGGQAAAGGGPGAGPAGGGRAPGVSGPRAAAPRRGGTCGRRPRHGGRSSAQLSLRARPGCGAAVCAALGRAGQV